MIDMRKFGVIGRTYLHLNRYRQILQVLFKYGFGDLIERLNIDHYLEIGLRMISRKGDASIESFSRAERVRMAFEELGPTFVKVGQVLSTRPDLVPLEYIDELAKLQDRVPPMAIADVREVILSETGETPEALFQHFDDVPLAAASIGQVHRARHKNGDDVVVKVRRKGIRRKIEIDLEIMHHLAALAEEHVAEIEVHRPTRIVREFARTLERELNYQTEKGNIERFAKRFAADDTIYVPRIYAELSSNQMLTMEYIKGVKVSEVAELRAAGGDLKCIAERGANLIMKQVFVHGYFHGDPHPGNVRVLPNNVICLLDFGIVGRISRQEREDFTELIMQLVAHDERGIAGALLRLTDYEREPDRGELEKDLLDVVDLYINATLDNFDFSRLIHRHLDVVKRHGLTLKSFLFPMIRAIAAVEGIGRALDPDFDLVKQAEPFVRSVHTSRFNPRRIVSETMETGGDFLVLLQNIPNDIREIMRLLKSGHARIEFQHRGLENFLFTIDQISNRIAYAIVLASLIIASSLVVLSGIPPRWNEIPVIGLGGYLVAGVMGLWLLISIIRHGRM